MEKEYPIKKKKKEFFRAYIEMIRPFLKGISNREADIFSEIIYQSFKRVEIKDKKDRFKLILSNEGRTEIEERLNISRATLRNGVCSLKAKGLIRQDNTIHDAYLIEPTGEKASIKFTFELEND